MSTHPVNGTRPIVSGLWIGKELSPLATLCVRSYLANGFRVRLFVYDPVDGIPAGVDVADATTVLSRGDIFTHHTGSFAPFADWFRYRLLAQQGGIWSDLDVLCLRPFQLPPVWFAMEDSDHVGNALMAFPAKHPVPDALARFAEDPATVLPWDGKPEIEQKERLSREIPDVRQRRINASWAATGPPELTKALRHFECMADAASRHTAYFLPFQCWEHACNGVLKSTHPNLENAMAVHLWGEMHRRHGFQWEKLVPDSFLHQMEQRLAHSIPAQALHGGAPKLSRRILVGVCSSHKHPERREAVRTTWASEVPDDIGVRFFVGAGAPLPDEPDTWVLLAHDSYEALPAKVLEFFREALQCCDFEWLFKCDDDTYLDLTRLDDLIDGEHDFVGNEFLTSRGSPSGGAGYLLSRRMVEALAEDRSLAAHGPEDIIVGEAALRHGAKWKATERLCWNSSRFPRNGNDTITSHWCSPERLQLVHELRSQQPREILARHRFWQDTILLYPNGTFVRKSAPCEGVWEGLAEDIVKLVWKQWGIEYLIPAVSQDNDEDATPVASHDCKPVLTKTLTVELRGGLGNQMFQYAHALSVAKRANLELRVGWANYGRPFGLQRFGIQLDPDHGELYEMFENEEGYRSDREWPSYEAISNSTAEHFRVAGYYQHENYFKPVADEVRRIFKVEGRRPAGSEGRAAVAVHVRRGDFVGSGHELCRPRYYEQAMRIMRNLVQHPLFVMVSDDPEWCRKQYGVFPDVMILESRDDTEAWQTLAGCDAFILSNSTFGWWAAWLADRHPVIAPNRFLGGQDWNISPDHWITLPPQGFDEGVFTTRVPATERKRIALAVIATNKYTRFLPDLLKGADKHFLAGHEVDYFVFTDQTVELETQRRVRVCSTAHESWISVIMARYSILLQAREELRGYDHIFHCDADMRFIGEVGPEILGERVATQHPGFAGQRGTPERRPESRAFVPDDVPMQYFCGGFQGGSAEEFLRMAELIDENIRIDHANGITAVWHDESHRNRYLVDHPPTVILDPGYCWVRNYHPPYVPRIEALDKNHTEMRL